MPPPDPGHAKTLVRQDEGSQLPANDLDRSLTILGDPADSFTDAARMASQLHEDMAHAVVVRMTVDDVGGVRTRLYRDLRGAELAMKRAEARGRTAVLVLCELRPLEAA